jgi:hypothetical protein
MRRCADCGARNPYLVQRGDEWVCTHRSACEARQMLVAGEPVEAVAAHAQNRVSDEMVDRGWEAARQAYRATGRWDKAAMRTALEAALND